MHNFPISFAFASTLVRIRQNRLFFPRFIQRISVYELSTKYGHSVQFKAQNSKGTFARNVTFETVSKRSQNSDLTRVPQGLEVISTHLATVFWYVENCFEVLHCSVCLFPISQWIKCLNLISSFMMHPFCKQSSNHGSKPYNHSIDWQKVFHLDYAA